MEQDDVTNRIERLEVFEERLGVALESLSAFIADYEGYDQLRELTVCGELHSRNGADLQENVILVVAAYDSSGRVIATKNDTRIEATSFYGFAPFQITVNLPQVPLAKVRVYPSKSKY